MSYEEWGPLAGMIGTWESDFAGTDVSFHNEENAVGNTTYREKKILKPFGPVDNGGQQLYGLDYRMSAFRQGEDNPFHTEVGYWMWDAQRQEVYLCFMVPRAQVVIAGGKVAPDATTFTLKATHGSTTYGILSNPYLEEVTYTPSFEVTFTVGPDTLTYDETTTIDHKILGKTMAHTDKNTLKLVSRED